MDKFKFMKRAFALTAVVSAIVFVFVGINSPIEAGMSVFGHVMKCIFGWAFVTVILEVFTFSLGQIAYHWVDDYKDKYGKRWFVEGIKDDFRYIKEHVTWKKVFKYVGIYVGFFALCLVIFYLLDLLVA
jgi:hypothetical protein